MSDLILALNAGSSSLKFAVHEAQGDQMRIDACRLEGIGTELASARIGDESHILATLATQASS